jgi:hypothetical protein
VIELAPITIVADLYTVDELRAWCVLALLVGYWLAPHGRRGR